MDARYAGDHQFLTRFQLEARTVARLKDPGLVAVYDQGIDGRHPFLVMELVEGGTLRELLRERGPMPPHAVAAVLRPVLGGLAVAHRAGLVHRDVKPENVLISDDGEVKIADFGLVRAVAQAGITSTSVILGTAAYLSPEQVSSGNAGPRSDVYSDRASWPTNCSPAHTPFTGDNALALAYQRMDNDVPPPSRAIDGVPPQFDGLVLRATARDPAERYADAQEMGAELDADRRGTGPASIPRARARELRPAHLGRAVPQPDGRQRATQRRPQTAPAGARGNRRFTTRPASSPADPTTGEAHTRATDPTRTNTQPPQAIRRHRAERIRVGPPARPPDGAVLGGAGLADPHRLASRRRTWSNLPAADLIAGAAL